jgi:exopolysaccharide biosynthesis protein
MSNMRRSILLLPRRSFNATVRTAAVLAVALSTLVLLPAANVQASGTTSSNVTVSQTGLHIFSINGRPYGITTAIHILTFNGSQFSIAIGLAHHAIDGGLETTSSMCQSTPNCVAAINGDFFDFTKYGAPDPGDEVGGIIQNCVLVHSPEISHQQADLDGRSVSYGFNWSGTLTVNGTSIPITAINQELPLSYVNVNLPLKGTLLYTAPYALETPSAPGRSTYEFTAMNSTSPTTINATADLQYVGETSQPVKVGAGDVDISTPADSALATLQPGDGVTLTTDSTAGCNNIGGHPVLINQGAIAPVVRADTYMIKPYARSVIGWTATGVTVLMTVDGQDAVSGATAYQLDSVLRSLGVVNALDLDGGNSTTFYAEGRVLNTPSRGIEHPVSTGLLVIATP